MHIWKIVMAACVLMAAGGSAQARIGETEAQCVARYGKPVKVLPKGLLFAKNGMRIYVTFSGGVADCIFLQKADGAEAKSKALPISEGEIQKFLSENSHGCQWRYSSVLPDGDMIWITKESEMGALYSQATCSLQVYTRENILK